MDTRIQSTAGRWFMVILGMFLLYYTTSSTSAQQIDRWDETVGKRVMNYQGETLGRISDTAVDLEHGRFVGVLVTSGGFMGIAQRTVVVPPAALKASTSSGTLLLDISKERFREAPTFDLPATVGVAESARMAQVYRYYGQAPYFIGETETAVPGSRSLERLGYIQHGSRVLLMPVENLRGERLGMVLGLRDLNRKTGSFAGVVVALPGYANALNKVIPPTALSYSADRKALQLDDFGRPFEQYADLTFVGRGLFVERESPQNGGNYYVSGAP